MQWRRLMVPRRLTPKCVLLLAVVGIALILLGVLHLRELNGSHPSGRMSEVHQDKFPNYHGRLFRADSSEDGEDDELTFVHLERKWKEPEWEVAEILQQLPTMKKPVVPVIVVEEHYEVLKYWFDAVRTGVIPASGNTLLHIDGHSDGAPPRDLSLVPWFRLPRNHSEVANMMQSNDVFIAGSGLAGLIHRFIWVWPDWDRAEHAEESDHRVTDVMVGWRTYYPLHGKNFRRLCACEKTRSGSYRPNSTKGDDWECWDDEPDKSEMGHGPMIHSLQCSAELTGVVEFVHESKALELLKQGDWIREEEKVLLDIDEDYYGCESSVMPLYKAGLSKYTIQRLSKLIGKLLCVNDVHHESVADTIFHTLVQIVQDFKASLCLKENHQNNKYCLSDLRADQALIQMIPRVSDSLKEARVEGMLCDRASQEVMLQIMLRILYDMNITQLEALSYVGVCLETAPTNFQFEAGSLHVCHGFNVPGDTQVTFHVPTEHENDVRSELLKSTLSLLPKQPTLVTVCRSMRDGYTPWAFFGYIEKAVIEILDTVFKDVTENSFHFDENLLGGRKGWPDRHKH